MFKGVKRDDVNNMKMTLKNVSSHLSLAYTIFLVGSSAGAKHSLIPKNFSPPYLPSGIATLLTGSVPEDQPIKVNEKTVQYSMQKYNQLVVCHHLMDSITFVTSISTTQFR